MDNLRNALTPNGTDGPGSTDDPSHRSSSLPFGRNVPLPSVNGPTYLTGQTLVQQVAYALSHNLYSYSPDTFDLDLSVQYWRGLEEKNALGYTPSFLPMQTRTGAGAVTLGYMSSKDADATRRHVPQTILASSGSVGHLRCSLEQLVHSYKSAKPTVLHIAAVDYEAGAAPALNSDYVAAQTLADELGLGLVSSTSAHEMQHMALFATLMADFVPTIHTYDGIHVARETTRVIDVLDLPGLLQHCQAIKTDVSQKDGRDEWNVNRLMRAFNDQLGTDYKLFEYHGHAEPLTIFVVFGSVEASLSIHLVRALAERGSRVGVVHVRVYRPFADEEFLEALAPSVTRIAVLGQVKDDQDMADTMKHSPLYADVLAAVTFTTHIRDSPTVVDLKYSRSHIWEPKGMSTLIQQVGLDTNDAVHEQTSALFITEDMQQYTFWDLDSAASSTAPLMVAELLSGNSAINTNVRTTHDNFVLGGAVRTDIRTAQKSIEALHSVLSADVSFVGDERFLGSVDVLQSSKQGALVVVKLPDYKEDQLENRLGARARKTIATKELQLYILDTNASPMVAEDANLQSFLVQLAFLKLARSDLYSGGLQKLKQSDGVLDTLASDLDKALKQITVPDSWQTVESEETAKKVVLQDLNANSFVSVTDIACDMTSKTQTWTEVAKALTFKEAYATKSEVRPDLGIKTAIVTVKEHRRLTPPTYDRNIFHIDFDLGDSGLTYEIGEALGVHPENDAEHVSEFIKWYGLNADDIVPVPSREDTSVLEARTVYQALLQNIDIFGRPPKRFYEALADFADDDAERTQLLLLGTGGNQEAQNELKRRAEVDTVTYADVLQEFPSAHPALHDIIKIVNPIKRREYSVASSQKVQPNSISLLIVTVNWVDPKGRDRFGQCTRYLNALPLGARVTVSVKASVMKLPASPSAPIIMAGLGTGLAPFRAFVQERAYQKQHGENIGAVMLYMGSRHQREEYLYGEEWEAYLAAGVITHMGCAFSRDQPQKIYIQDRMRQTLPEIRKSYLQDGGAFYLCGPTWPVPDVTNVLEEAIELDASARGSKVDSRREIDRLKDELRYVLEVY